MRKSYRPSAMRAQGHRIQALVALVPSLRLKRTESTNLNRQTQLPRYRSYGRARRCNSTTQSIVPAPFPLQETRILPSHTHTHLAPSTSRKLQSPNIEAILPSLNHAPPALSPVPPSNLYTFHSQLRYPNPAAQAGPKYAPCYCTRTFRPSTFSGPPAQSGSCESSPCR